MPVTNDDCLTCLTPSNGLCIEIPVDPARLRELGAEATTAKMKGFRVPACLACQLKIASDPELMPLVENLMLTRRRIALRLKGPAAPAPIRCS